MPEATKTIIIITITTATATTVATSENIKKLEGTKKTVRQRSKNKGNNIGNNSNHSKHINKHNRWRHDTLRGSKAVAVATGPLQKAKNKWKNNTGNFPG